jgi:predicted ATPase
MLTEIKLTNFKCFKEETSIPLSQFNLFTGVNGAGKSTALQALLLMRQSIEHNPYTTELILNGSCVNLGSFDDVKNREISRENSILFEITANYEDDKFLVRYHLKPITDEMSLSIFKIDMILYEYIEYAKEYRTVDSTIIYDEETGLYCESGEDVYKKGFRFRITRPFVSDIMYTIEKATNLLNLNFNIERVHFISADRIGPKEVYKKSALPEFPILDANGEFTVNLLNTIGQQLVNEALCLGDDSKTLLTQTEAWMSKVLDVTITLKITPLRVNILELLINDLKPGNVGFGYSSILPIIVTGLIAKPGEKIIIENPEIHLHPKAQSALIEFLIKVSNTGVQVFIESHSDHIINGVLVQCKKHEESKNNGISRDNVTINYFYKDEENKSIINKIEIEEGGRIYYTPAGFFDQFTIDYEFLMGF